MKWGRFNMNVGGILPWDGVPNEINGEKGQEPLVYAFSFSLSYYIVLYYTILIISCHTVSYHIIWYDMNYYALSNLVHHDGLKPWAKINPSSFKFFLSDIWLLWHKAKNHTFLSEFLGEQVYCQWVVMFWKISFFFLSGSRLKIFSKPWYKEMSSQLCCCVCRAQAE
jgi:hypothetical protein